MPRHSHNPYIGPGCDDSTVRVWRVDQPNAMPLILRGHKSSVDSVAFSPDGTRLASPSSLEEAIRVWMVSPESLAQKICSHAGRNLSLEEWRQFVSPDIPSTSAPVPTCQKGNRKAEEQKCLK